MQPYANAQQWACMDCGARGGVGGSCASCGEGPLVDTWDPQVRSMLVLQDGERTRARGGKLLIVSAGVAAVVGFPLVFVAGPFVGMAMLVVCAGGLYAVLNLVFPYKRRFMDLGR